MIYIHAIYVRLHEIYGVLYDPLKAMKLISGLFDGCFEVSKGWIQSSVCKEHNFRNDHLVFQDNVLNSL